MRDKILMGIILLGMVFFFIVMPAAVAYGVVSGVLDIETLELKTYGEKQMNGMGGY